MFALTADHLAVRDMAKSFADERLAPNALRWDETEHFPADVLREAAALGMAAIYVGEQHGGSGMTRLDAALIFEALSTGDPCIAAFLSIHNMVSWVVEGFGSPELKEPLSASPRQHGIDRELLPDRAGLGLRRRCADDARAARRRRLRARRRQAVHLWRGRQRRLSRDGAHRRGRPVRDLRLPGRQWRAGPEFRGE